MRGAIIPTPALVDLHNHASGIATDLPSDHACCAHGCDAVRVYHQLAIVVLGRGGTSTYRRLCSILRRNGCQWVPGFVLAVMEG
jgi:hypothetical protein